MVVRLCEGGHGITRREWGVLALLHGQPQGLRPSELAERMARDRARTSRTITALTAKGLIERSPLPNDRRRVHVCLTPAGQALYAQLMPQVRAVNARILEALDAPQKQVLDEMLERLRQRAQALLDELGPDLPKADRRRGRHRTGA